MQQSRNQGHILIVSHDVVGRHMAGPGIRYYNLAKVLSQEFEVVLAVPCEVTPALQGKTLQMIQYTRREWNTVEQWLEPARVVIIPSVLAGEFPQIAEKNVPVVIDGYDPLLIEWLVLSQHNPQEQEAHWGLYMYDLNRQYLLGDFFVCASERQRDWWVGLLEANGRINPWTLREDSSLRRLLDVVPYGLQLAPLHHSRPVIRGVWPGIEEGDKIILWGGGLWPWLDPLTAVRAVIKLWECRQDIRLIFPGTGHPNPIMKGITTHVAAARQIAANAGLLDRAVFFGEWAAYEDWPNILCESDVALMLHPQDTLETRLAFRSRVLDYIWAGLPIISTRGDATSEIVAHYDVGTLVRHQDVDGVAEALARLLDTPRETYADRFAQARQDLNWEQAARPLVDFCRFPRRAPDKVILGEQLGNPFYRREFAELYQKEIGQLKEQNAHLQTLVQVFERRRVVRLTDWVRKIFSR